MRSIPKKDSDFNVTQATIVSEVSRNSETWKLDAEWITSTLTPAQKSWDKAWTNYQPVSSRTPAITFAKNEARKTLENLLRKLVKNLQSNVRITEDDLKRMNIAIPQSARTPSQVPDTYPVCTVDTGTIRRLSFHYRDSNKVSVGKPHGIHGAEIKWGIGISPADGPDNFPNSSFDTHTPTTIGFTEADRGKTVYYCLRWHNTVGEKGPWGEIGKAIIP